MDPQFAALCLKPWTEPPKGRADWWLGALSKNGLRRAGPQRAYSLPPDGVDYGDCRTGYINDQADTNRTWAHSVITGTAERAAARDTLNPISVARDSTSIEI